MSNSGERLARRVPGDMHACAHASALARTLLGLAQARASGQLRIRGDVERHCELWFVQGRLSSVALIGEPLAKSDAVSALATAMRWQQARTRWQPRDGVDRGPLETGSIAELVLRAAELALSCDSEPHRRQVLDVTARRADEAQLMAAGHEPVPHAALRAGPLPLAAAVQSEQRVELQHARAELPAGVAFPPFGSEAPLVQRSPARPGAHEPASLESLHAGLMPLVATAEPVATPAPDAEPKRPWSSSEGSLASAFPARADAPSSVERSAFGLALERAGARLFPASLAQRSADGALGLEASVVLQLSPAERARLSAALWLGALVPRRRTASRPYSLLLRKRQQLRAQAGARALLELGPDADASEARRALRRLAAHLHPDALGPTEPASLRAVSSDMLCALGLAEESVRRASRV